MVGTSWPGSFACTLHELYISFLTSRDGESALYVACVKNHGEIVDRLLLANADVNLQKEVRIVTKMQSLAREMAFHRKEECRD